MRRHLANSSIFCVLSHFKDNFINTPVKQRNASEAKIRALRAILLVQQHTNNFFISNQLIFSHSLGKPTPNLCCKKWLTPRTIFCNVVTSFWSFSFFLFNSYWFFWVSIQDIQSKKSEISDIEKAINLRSKNKLAKQKNSKY